MLWGFWWLTGYGCGGVWGGVLISCGWFLLRVLWWDRVGGVGLGLYIRVHGFSLSGGGGGRL